MKITLIILATLGILSAIGYLYIKQQYRLFCAREDQKERIAELRKKVESARLFVRRKYGSGFDKTVPENIVPKVDFLEMLILKKSPDEQEKELNFLIDMLVETFTRLEQNYDDVASIVSPLNSMRDRLVQEHLQYIKNHMDEEWIIDV